MRIDEVMEKRAGGAMAKRIDEVMRKVIGEEKWKALIQEN